MFFEDSFINLWIDSPTVDISLKGLLSSYLSSIDLSESRLYCYMLVSFVKIVLLTLSLSRNEVKEGSDDERMSKRGIMSSGDRFLRMKDWIAIKISLQNTIFSIVHISCYLADHKIGS